MDPAPDPWSLATSDAATLGARLGDPDVLVVTGSGWARAVSDLGRALEQMPVSELEGVPEPTVAGHGGTLRTVERGGHRVLVLGGRSHLYEGLDAHRVVHAVRASVLAGCRTVVLTNAAGSLRRSTPVGTPVVISDQLNLTGTSPLVGPQPPAGVGSRFADMTELYDPQLQQVALEADDGAASGVYAGLLGGVFETPAEIRMLATLGADLVGMSTVLEAIVARHLGARVFGVSLVTNLAAGLQATLDHEEVLAAGEASADRLAALVAAVIAAS